MSLVEHYHQEHKARLQRIAARAIVERPVPKIKSVPFEMPIAPEKRLRNTVPQMKTPWFVIIGDDSDPVMQPKIADIVKIGCQYFDCLRKDVMSKRRDAPIVHARHVMIYVAKIMTDKSYPEIARRFGNRDHTTALHCVRKMETLCHKNWIVAYDIAQLEAALRYKMEEENDQAIRNPLPDGDMPGASSRDIGDGSDVEHAGVPDGGTPDSGVDQG